MSEDTRRVDRPAPNLGMIRGRAVSDAEMAPSGKAVRFSIAVPGAGHNRDDRDDNTGFFDVVAFGEEEHLKTVARSVTKGATVSLSYRLQHSRWSTAEGNKRSKIGLVAENISVDRLVENADAATEEADSDDNTDWFDL